MNTTTLSDLRLRCRERADKVNSGFISDAELTRLINTKLSKLWSFLTTQYTDMFVLPPVTIAVTSGTEYVQLPTDFLMAVGVFGLDGDERIKLSQFNIDELSSVRTVWGAEAEFLEVPRYRIIGRRIYLSPRTFELTEIELWYVPTCTKLESDADLVPFDLPEGWEECIVNGVAALIKLKEEADASPYLQLESQYYQECATYAADRDASRPSKIVDIEEDWR